MHAPDPTDFLDVRSMLGERELELQRRARRLMDEQARPRIARAFDEHRFPEELIPVLAQLGALGCNLEGYGCPGLGHSAP